MYKAVHWSTHIKAVLASNSHHSVTLALAVYCDNIVCTHVLDAQSSKGGRLRGASAIPVYLYFTLVSFISLDGFTINDLLAFFIFTLACLSVLRLFCLICSASLPLLFCETDVSSGPYLDKYTLVSFFHQLYRCFYVLLP